MPSEPPGADPHAGWCGGRRGEPGAYPIRDGLIAASQQLAPEGVKLCPRPLRVGNPLELKTPRPALPADMREAQKPQRLRLAETPLLTLLGGEPPKPDQSRLLGVQLQAELREPVAKIRPEPLGVVPMLESHHEVVSKTRDDDVTARVPAPPLVSPQVEDVVQVDVRQER